MKRLMLCLPLVLLMGMQEDCPETPEPEPTPTATPTPTSTPTPTPEPAPSPVCHPEEICGCWHQPPGEDWQELPECATPTPTPGPTATPTPVPEIPGCGDPIPDDPVRVDGACRSSDGFVKRDGVCVAVSTCGPEPTQGNGKCLLTDLLYEIAIEPPPPSNGWCFHLPYVAHRYDLRDGFLCNNLGCLDAYGRWIQGGQIAAWWNYPKVCPPIQAAVCQEPEPTPTPTPPPGPTAEPTPDLCPWCRLGIAPNDLRKWGGGGNRFTTHVTPRFCPDGMSSCGHHRGQPCNSDTQWKRCGGRLCEPHDAPDEPHPLRFQVTATNGVAAWQRDDDPYWVGMQVPPRVDEWKVTVCLSPGNVSEAGDVLRVVADSCRKVTYKRSQAH